MQNWFCSIIAAKLNRQVFHSIDIQASGNRYKLITALTASASEYRPRKRPIYLSSSINQATISCPSDKRHSDVLVLVRDHPGAKFLLQLRRPVVIRAVKIFLIVGVMVNMRHFIGDNSLMYINSDNKVPGSDSFYWFVSLQEHRKQTLGLVNKGLSEIGFIRWERTLAKIRKPALWIFCSDES